MTLQEPEKMIIRLEGVEKSFGTQKVLNGIDLSIPEGRTTVIVGASGQGKSVLIKHMLGLLRADCGRVLVNGLDIAAMNKKQLKETRTKFGVLFQGAALFDSITVFDNVALPLRERTHMTKIQIRKKVLEKLSLLDLDGVDQKYPAQLSGGMKKRVGLARALVLEPRIVFLDEPTTGLDVKRSQEIYRLFHRTQAQFGYTAVIVSHDAPKIFKLADYIALIADKKIQGCLSPEDFQLSDNPYIKAFVEETMGSIYISGTDRS
ncbi:MAG TPA: ATP-binding cassette domain-containing protein [Thermodesulfobacteriaceae bacterium]|nr:ATP-binding cassette domain-containing protein [Thermodesulfobacteriaceae bacterium]